MKKIKKHLHQLIKEDDSQKISEFVLAHTTEVVEIVKQTCETSTKDAPQLINVLLNTFGKDVEDRHFKYKIFVEVVTYLKNRQPNEREAADLVSTLMIHADNLATEDLVKLVDFCVSSIKLSVPFEGRWTEMLGRFLSLVSKRENIIYNGTAIEGDIFISTVIKKICEINWCIKTTITLLQIFKELQLPKEELCGILKHLERNLDELDFLSIPPVMYHLVLLGQVNLPKETLKMILDYFEKHEERRDKAENHPESTDIDSISDSDITGNKNFEDLTDAEGTVALHITHFSQYNPCFVKEHLKEIKSSTWLPENIVTPFNLILLLSLSSIDRYRDQIIESLKSCILKAFRFHDNENKSFWLHGTFQKKFELVNIFQKTISNCKAGWVQVYEGMVYLCFSLLESGGGPKADTYSAKQCIVLASKIIPLTVKKEPHLALQALKKFSCFIYTTSNPSQYIETLNQLVATCPLLLMEHLSILQEFLESISFLSVTSAAMLIHSLLPLIKMSMALKDSLMVVFRKMLYSKQVESRQIAVQGFLLFLRHFKVLGTLPSSQASTSFSSSFSQVSVDVHTAMDPSSNESFCFELLSILRRVLSQQHQVKSLLYTGLPDVIQSNPKLAPNILQTLHSQVNLFLDLRDDILNPILLNKICSTQGESVVLVEPPGQLLSCLSLCKTSFEHSLIDSHIEEDEARILKNIRTTFENLISKLKNVDLDDVGINKDEFSHADVRGKKALVQAETMVAIFEALMQESFCNSDLNTNDGIKDVKALYKSQKKIIEAASKPPQKAGKKAAESGKAKRKGPSPKANFTFKSILGMKMATEMFEACFASDGDAALQENAEIQMYLLSVVNHDISSFKDFPLYQRKKLIPHLKTIGGLLLKECTRSVAVHDPDDNREVERVRTCLSTFAAIIVSCRKFFRNKFESIIKEISGKTPMGNLTSYSYSIYKKCQEMLKRIVFHEDSEAFLKDAVVIVEIMRELALQMEPSSKEIKKVQEWLLQLCKDQSIDSALVCEKLVGLLLSVTDLCQERNLIPRSVARELHSHFGDIEQNVTISREGKYKIVSSVSASSIMTALLSYFEDFLGTAEVALYRLKALMLSNHNDTFAVEKNLAFKFAIIIQSIGEFTITALPHGSNIDSVIRIAAKLYGSLTQFVRYYLELFRINPDAKLTEEFENMVTLSFTLIKTQSLQFINYENETQQQEKLKKKTNILLARVQKESKLIPALIFNLEKYETVLLQLSKKSSVNLLLNAKLGTNRDFRIKVPVLEQLGNQDQEDPEEEDNQVDQNGDSDGEPPPPTKKKRKN